MPRPCAVEVSRLQLQNTSEAFLRMPRPCAVEPHVCSYQKGPRKDATALCRGRLTLAATKYVRSILEDATALRRGASRLQLPKRAAEGCHGLVPWKAHARSYKIRQKHS